MNKQLKARLLKQLHQWHWVSSAIALVGMLLFSITGITLNHAADIESSPKVTSAVLEVPMALLDELPALQGKAPLPSALAEWLAQALDIGVGNALAEWSSDEIYLGLPRPGGDAWLSIDLDSGELEYENTSRGMISYLNDLHKGRNTGVVWFWFIDVFAVASIVFSVTGLFLLQMHASRRPSTWPLVGAGLVIPFLIAVLFIH